LEHRSPLQLLIATILSAQCSDRQVNRVTPALFEKYRSAADFAQAPLPELESMIQRIGLFRAKARNIQSACRALVERHAGQVPSSLDALIQLDGVGRKTANVVLGDAFGLTCGIVVDTHVVRLSQRLGLTRQTTPEKIEQELCRLTPKEEWIRLSHLLIWHGRRRCDARKPDCAGCEIQHFCPVGVKMTVPQPDKTKGT
jgi:endonuclease-3